jgi:hypothetical protein
MTQQDDKKRKHLILSGTAEAEQFTSAGAGGGGPSIPQERCEISICD